MLLFGAPLCIATAELTGRFEHEGGLYAWTAGAFGPFWGFLTGWLYWVCNLPFFASVLVFMVSFIAPALGAPGRAVMADPALFAAATVALAIGVGALHLAGLGTGKWLSNVGGTSNVVLVAVLAATAVGVALTRGPATDLVRAGYAPRLDATGAILWATMVFAIVGPESLAFLKNDVRGGARTILPVLVMLGLTQIVFYVLGTGSMLAILTPQAATRLSGLPDALTRGLTEIGLGATAPVALVGGFLCALGLYSAWFGVAARLPFAAGIDAYLPAAFGRRDPRTGAPTAAIAAQIILVVAIVLISQAGETLRAAYDFLVAMSVLSTTLPFLAVFAVYLVERRRPAPAGAWRLPGGPVAGYAVGLTGLCATALAVGCTLVPSPDARDPLIEVVKLVAASALLIGAGVAFYVVARRRTER